MLTRRFVKNEELEYASVLIAAPYDGYRKNGFQYLCGLLETGSVLSAHQRLYLVPVFAKLLHMRSFKTRIWMAKAMGLARLREFCPYLLGLLHSEDEIDDETRSWTLAAYSVLVDRETLVEAISRPEFGPMKTAFALSAQFYQDKDLGLGETQQSVLTGVENDSLTAKWYTFMYGYGRAAERQLSAFADREIVGDLTGHEDDSVSEHALWALNRAPDGSISNSRVYLETLERRPPNVRRWYYRLAAKTNYTAVALRAFLWERTKKEGDNFAREGLATALASHFSSQEIEKMLEWYFSEEDESVRIALMPHFIRNVEQAPSYVAAIADAASQKDSALLRSLFALTTDLPSVHPARQTILRQMHRRRHQYVLAAEPSKLQIPTYLTSRNGVGGPISDQTAENASLVVPLSGPNPSGTIRSDADLAQLVRIFINDFGDYIRQQGGWKLLWDDNAPRAPKNESTFQQLLKGSLIEKCKMYDIDISPETNIGRGHVDFKLSVGYSARTLIEAKLASNKRFWHGLSRQLPEYLKAEGILSGFFVVCVYSDEEMEKISTIDEKITALTREIPYTIDAIIVDARANRPSASKL